MCSGGYDFDSIIVSVELSPLPPLFSNNNMYFIEIVKSQKCTLN